MAETNFYLNTRANSKGLRGILMYFRYHGNQIVISTGKYIKIDDWDKIKQKAKIKFEDHSNLNLKITEIKNKIGIAYSRYELHNSDIDNEELKSIFKQIMFPDTFLLTDKQKDSGLIDFVDHIINSQANIKNADTLKTYRSCRKHLKEFEETIFKKQITFNDIDLDFFSYFTDFLIVKHDHQNNTLNKYIGILRYFMSEAEERNLHQNYAYKSSRFNVPRTEVDTIYLTTEELNKILNLDLTKNPKLKKAKDLFYIASQTGLRFSALYNLTDETIDQKVDYFFLSKIPKVYKTLSIPIHQSVKDILTEYKAKTGSYIPGKYSNKELNLKIKKLGQLAGIDEIITLNKRIGNKTLTITYHKYELITTHTARRSFATNLYLQGVPVYIIMAITGHKTEKAFLKYVKISQAEYAKELKEMWDNQLN